MTYKSRTGFTLIEVVIAMMIFGVGVLVLLRAILFFIGQGDEARKRAQATLLAKEGLELVLSQRDTNVLRGVQWDCARITYITPGSPLVNDACDVVFASSGTYTLSSSVTGYIFAPILSGNSGALYLQQIDGVDRYVSDSSGIPTDFVRTITIANASNQGVSLPSSHVKKVIVRVWYMPAAPARAVVLESYMAAWETIDQ